MTFWLLLHVVNKQSVTSRVQVKRENLINKLAAQAAGAHPSWCISTNRHHSFTIAITFEPIMRLGCPSRLRISANWTCLFGPVYLDLSIWTCLIGPIYLDLSLWAHLFGPIYLDPSFWTYLFGPVYFDPSFGTSISPSIWTHLFGPFKLVPSNWIHLFGPVYLKFWLILASFLYFWKASVNKSNQK